MKQHTGESGQVLIMAVLALAIFLIGAVGLAIDGSNLFSQRQMAQTAADAAAQSAIMSIFDHTYTSAGFNPADGDFYCGINGAKTPCKYAGHNGFGGTSADGIHVEFPPRSAAPPGVTLSASDPYPLVRATVTRYVPTTLMRYLVPSASLVKAVALAAITQEIAPVPILVTHPTLPESLKVLGNPTIKICGGPGQSIQVNSSSESPALPAYSPGGSAVIDLSRAGNNSDGTCLDSPTGANFGVFGGLSAPPVSSQGQTVNFVKLGPDGDYLQPNSPIEDPLKDVNPPVRANILATYGMGLRGATTMTPGANGCPLGVLDCHLYSPGIYPTGMCVKGETAVFKPGIYYIDRGPTSGSCKNVAFGNYSNGNMVMSKGFTDPITTQGMLVYNASQAGTTPQLFEVATSNSTASLVGTPINSVYKGMLFFQRRDAPPTSKWPDVHKLGGGGDMTLAGTLYFTNTLENMTTVATQYQTLHLQGGGTNGTIVRGMIIVSVLELGGGGTITMNLSRDLSYTIRKVALVK